MLNQVKPQHQLKILPQQNQYQYQLAQLYQRFQLMFQPLSKLEKCTDITILIITKIDKMILLNQQTIPLKKMILPQSQCFQLAFQLELKVLKIRLLVLHALRKTQNQCAQETYFQLSKKERNKPASSGLPAKL